MSVDVVRRRFTVDEYLQMAQAGILNEDDRVDSMYRREVAPRRASDGQCQIEAIALVPSDCLPLAGVLCMSLIA
jgi:hypothetical protein